MNAVDANLNRFSHIFNSGSSMQPLKSANLDETFFRCTRFFRKFLVNFNRNKFPLGKYMHTYVVFEDIKVKKKPRRCGAVDTASASGTEGSNPRQVVYLFVWKTKQCCCVYFTLICIASVLKKGNKCIGPKNLFKSCRSSARTFRLLGSWVIYEGGKRLKYVFVCFVLSKHSQFRNSSSLQAQKTHVSSVCVLLKISINLFEAFLSKPFFLTKKMKCNCG
jgi:hypothetical protein